MLSRDFPKIRISKLQLDTLKRGSRAAPRGNLIPELRENITSFENIDAVDRTTKVKTIRTIAVPSDVTMIGIPTIAATELLAKNRGPTVAKVDVIDPAGGGGDSGTTTVKKELAVGEETACLFEGSLVISILHATPSRNAKARIAFDRYFLSNFIGLEAVGLPVEGSEGGTIGAVCVEVAFQITKALLTNDLDVLKNALDSTSCPALKKYMGTVKSVPPEWFSNPAGGEPLSQSVMEYFQAWCLTCPTRFEVLRWLMSIPMERGVRPEDIEIYEYNSDAIYGVGVLEGNFEPLLQDDYVPKGKNVLGSIVTSLSRKVVGGTHADYVKWFQESYPPLFALCTEETEKETSILGARTASNADLSPRSAHH